MFVSNEQSEAQICLKKWKAIKDDLYDAEDTEQHLKYLLQGWKYNSFASPGVHLGLAPIEFLGENIVQLGPLIRKPTRDNVQPNKKYALVMKRLDEDWQLDKQLVTGKLDTPQGMKFLAKKIARLHKKFARIYRKLNSSPSIFGTYKALSTKLELNEKCFNRALEGLKEGGLNVEEYREFMAVLKRGLTTYADFFQQRFEQGYIIRCHGDLKSTNLWICPSRFLGIKYRRLLALDCVDFRDDFSHIDALSDVAMLAVDIEMHLLSQVEAHDDRAAKLEMAKLFLAMYLREMHEDQHRVQPVLEYYMLEKSIVCAFMSILYAKDHTLGLQYLNIARIHADLLQNLLAWPKAIML
jgi:aminoglycoside phosphotransferase family enzyme